VNDRIRSKPVRRHLPLAARPGRQRQLVVITLLAAALLLVSYLAIRARQDDLHAADQAAARVADELGPQLDVVDLDAAYRAISSAADAGEPLPDFSTRPEVAGATLVEARATPDQVVLVYRVSTDGMERCITGARSQAAGTSVAVDRCRDR